ncbi:MAG: hypothetical protein ACT4N2_01355 [Hyphomicrobium sp.]
MAADAATTNLPFAGLVTAACVLTVGTPGVMAPDASYSNMSSDAGSGVAGTVAVLNTGGTYQVSAIAPSAFTLAPTGGGDNVNFTTTYEASGATNIGTTPGSTTTAVNAGLTNLTVDLSATKSSGTFAAGAYAAEVVVRCE